MITLNGVELKYVEEFEQWVEKLKQGFIDQKNYSGFPILPKCCDKGIELYEKANDDEKKFMMVYITTQFTEALRHWTVEKNVLYPRNKSLYPKDTLLHYLKHGWQRFWY